jgi:integrase
MNIHTLSDDEIIKEYFVCKEYKPKVKTYQDCIMNGFKKYLNNQGKTFRDFDMEDVRGYYRMKQDNDEWKSSSVQTFIVIVKSFCDWIRDEIDVVMIGKRDEDLDRLRTEKTTLKKIINMRAPKAPQRITSVPPVTLPELKKIFIAMIKNKTDNKNYAFKRMWLLCYFGCRVHEIGSITPNMLYLDDNKLHMMTEKTEVERKVFYDEFTKDIFKEYIEDNKLINVVPQAWWASVKEYSKVLGKKVYPKLGREAFNTNMDNMDFYYFEEDMKTHAKLDNNFAKIISGHTVPGLKDITARYRKYPDALIKAAMTEHHYLIPLEEDLKKLLSISKLERLEELSNIRGLRIDEKEQLVFLRNKLDKRK